MSIADQQRERLKRSLQNTLTMMVKMGAELPMLLDVMEEVVQEHRQARRPPPRRARGDPRPELCHHDDPSWCTRECNEKIQRLHEWMRRRTTQ
jgi:hypothetical protein